MSELTEQLRRLANVHASAAVPYEKNPYIMKELVSKSTLSVAADEIERLTTKVERYKEALVRVSDYKAKEYKQAARGHYCPYRSAIDGLQSIARHALDGEE